MNSQSVHRRALRAIIPCLVAGSLLASAAQAVAASPSIDREWVSGITPTDAIVSAEIDPEGLNTTYRFRLYREYFACPPRPGTVRCNAVLVDDLKLAPGNIPGTGGAVTISVKVSNEGEKLVPETEYYFMVEATNADGAAEGATALFKTWPDVPPPDPPVNIVPPAIIGTPEPGGVLFCGQGAWENNPAGYHYAWLRDGLLLPAGDMRIMGANGRNLEVQPEDRGHEFSCEVTAGNWGGSTSALSNVLQVPELPAAPANVDPPTLSGSPEVGATLACSPGTWENDPTDYKYDWLRDGSVVASGDSDLVVSAADRGHVLACAVTAGNEGGASQATSDGVAVPVETQPAPVEIQPSVALPAAALPVAPPVTGPIQRRKCRRVGHISRHRGAKTGAAPRQAGRSCHPRPRKIR